MPRTTATFESTDMRKAVNEAIQFANDAKRRKPNRQAMVHGAVRSALTQEWSVKVELI